MMESLSSKIENNFFTRWWYVWAFSALVIIAIHLYCLELPKASGLRDSSQLYFLGKAISTHVSPYLPISTLREMFLGIKDSYQSHPSPYPPLIAVCSWVFTFLSIKQFGYIFLIGNLLFLWGAVSELSLLAFGRIISLKARISIFSLLQFSAPIKLGIYFGQIDPLLLFLFSKSIRHLLKDSRSIFSGIIWTFVVQLKTLGWLTAIWLSMKDLKFLVGCVISSLIGGLLILNVLGLKEIMNYLSFVTVAVANSYGTYISNQSLLSFIIKLQNPLFVKSDMGSFVPVITEASFDPNLIAIIPLLAGGVFLTFCRNFPREVGIAISLLVSLIVSPISWGFYHIHLLLVLAVLTRNKIILPTWSYIGLSILLLFDIPDISLSLAHLMLSPGDEIIELSKAWVIFANIPLLFLITLSLTIYRSESQKALELAKTD